MREWQVGRAQAAPALNSRTLSRIGSARLQAPPSPTFRVTVYDAPPGPAWNGTVWCWGNTRGIGLQIDIGLRNVPGWQNADVVIDSICFAKRTGDVE